MMIVILCKWNEFERVRNFLREERKRKSEKRKSAKKEKKWKKGKGGRNRNHQKFWTSVKMGS